MRDSSLGKSTIAPIPNGEISWLRRIGFRAGMIQGLGNCMITSAPHPESTLRMELGVALARFDQRDLGSVPLGYMRGVCVGGGPK